VNTTAQESAPLALRGGTPLRSLDSWPTWPVPRQEDRDALMRVYDSGKWWYGEEVKRFEDRFAAFQDARHCVTCTSGTTAAEIALPALGVGPGDEVIVPPYTFVATAMSVARAGAAPVFVDVDDTWCLDPNQLEAAITPKTKAIMPVHFGGCLADMERINAIACERGLSVVEDACHSWGAKYKGKGTGALGRCGVFSFQQSKNITSAEGGCILTDDDDLAARMRSMTNSGRTPDGAWFEHHIIGTNARLTELQAVLLNGHLDRLPEETDRRIRNATILDEGLAGVEGIEPQPMRPGTTRRAYHLYCMRLSPDRFGCTRAAFVEAAKAEGLLFSTLYAIPLYEQPMCGQIAGRDYSGVSCPVTEDLCSASALALHHRFLLGSETDMHDVVAIVRKIKNNAGALAP